MSARLLLPLLMLSLAGCGSSRLDTFPGFPARKAHLATSSVIADFLILKATGGDTALVDLAATKATADTILEYVSERLNAKGYAVTNHVLSSAGLSMDSGFTANVVRTSGLDGPGEDATMSFHPPFYLYQALRRDPGMKSLLGDLYRRLARMEDLDRGFPPMPEAVPLGKAFGGGLLFVILGGGFEVSAGVQQAGTRTPWAEEGAKIGYQTVSQGSLHLFVLDTESGTVLWTDRQISKGGMMYNDKFIRMAEIVLEDLP